MQRFLIVVFLFGPVATGRGQDYPVATEEGKAALLELVASCTRTGGLRIENLPNGGERLQIGDPDKLKQAIASRGKLLTPALRDALVARWNDANKSEQPALAKLLRKVGEQTLDEKTLAFAAFCEGQADEEHQQWKAAREHYHEAQARFHGLSEPAWEGACFIYLALMAQQDEDADVALKNYESALTNWRKAYGENHPLTASCLQSMGLLHVSRGEYQQALKAYGQALAIQRKLLGSEHAQVAQLLSLMGFADAASSDYASALDHHTQALAIRRKIFGDQHPEVGISHNNLGSTYARLGNSAKALEHHRQALAIWRNAFGDEHPNIATSLNIIGFVLAADGDYRGAIEHYEQALAIRRKTRGENHPEVADTLNNLGSALAKLGEFTRALETQEKTLAIRQKLFGANHPQIANSLNNLGYIHERRGEYAQAVKLYQRALAISEKFYGEDYPEVAVVLNNLGAAYAEKGEFGKALECHQQALAIRRRRLGESHPDVANSLLNLGFVQSSLGDDRTALSTFHEMLKINREIHPKDHPDLAQALTSVGMAYTRLRDDDKALELLQSGLHMRQRIYGEDHLEVAASWNTLGFTWSLAQNDSEALTCYNRALAIRRQALGERNLDVAITSSNMGLVYAHQNQWDKAVETMRQAVLATRETSEAPNAVDELDSADLMPHSVTVGVLYHYGRALEASFGASPTAEQLRTCIKTYLLAADVLDRVREEVLETEASKVNLAGEHLELFPRLIGLYQKLFSLEADADALEEAFLTAERSSARVFLETLAQSRASDLGQIPSELREQEVELRATLRQLEERLAVQRAMPVAEHSISKLRELLNERQATESRLRQLAAQLQKEFPKYAALRYPEVCTLEEARACLNPRETALLYVLGTNVSYLVLLEGGPNKADASRGLAIYQLPPKADLARMAAAMTDWYALDKPARMRALGAEAYAALLAPCAERVHGRDLVIVPSGELCHMPFEILIEAGRQNEADDENRRYLIENHTIRYAPSLTVLHLTREWDQSRQAPARAFWGMGDPVYDPTDERLEGNQKLSALSQETLREYSGQTGMAQGIEGTLARLPFTAQELREVGAILGASDQEVLTGMAATEAAVKEASRSDILAQRRYIHFATHGILGVESGSQPCLVLSLVGSVEDDGFLQLDEATRLKLNADLVVLSACESGQGRLHEGEGVRGLSRAFLHAGSRAVLCSLWSVADQETARLMIEFYRQLEAGNSAAEALRTAKQMLIDEGQPPRIWAAFVLAGQSR